MKKHVRLLSIALFLVGNLSAQSETTPALDQTSLPVELNSSAPQVTQSKALGDCNIGNEDESLATTFPGNWLSGYISGVKFTLTEEGTLNSINIITQTSGESNVIMFVYDDLNGVPNDLLSTSGSAPVIIGTVTLPVTPIVLPPGDYWIMANFDQTGEHSKRILSSGNESYYQALPFGTPPPLNASSFILTVPNVDYLFFLDVTCTASIGIDELEDKVSSVYPNPASDNITIEMNESIFIDNIQVVDAIGRVVKSFRIDQLINTKSLNVSDISPGLYSLIITSDNQTIAKSIVIE